MSRLALSLIQLGLLPVSRYFNWALHDPYAAQVKVQQTIFAQLLQSQYGQALRLNTLADWSKVPIVDYEDLSPWIQQQQRSGKAMLTSEPVLCYEKTSGSRGPAKWIPYTRSLRRSFSHLFCIWANDLLAHGPDFSTGKVYFCISPQLTVHGQERGFQDDSEYLEGWLRWLLRPFLIMPSGLNQITDPGQFTHRLSLALLQEEALETISIWSPSFLTVLLNYIQAQAPQLRQALKGKISSQRDRLLQESEICWPQLWPHLKLISCWDSAQSADRADSLRTQFPQVLVQGKGLLATEAPITVPLIPANGCLPLLNEVFLEFLDQHQQIRLIHELETGAEYSLILSQQGGLYRYRIGDLVRVTHWYKATPCLQFLGREGVVSDLVGEKLQEEFVREALAQLPLSEATYVSLIPVNQPMPHYVLLLDRASHPVDQLAELLDRTLCQAHHYQQARLLGQLAPSQVWANSRIPAAIVDMKLHQGQQWGNIKHPLLMTAPIDLAQLKAQLG